jgi:hypothetical protein
MRSVRWERTTMSFGRAPLSHLEADWQLHGELVDQEAGQIQQYAIGRQHHLYQNGGSGTAGDANRRPDEKLTDPRSIDPCHLFPNHRRIKIRRGEVQLQ